MNRSFNAMCSVVAAVGAMTALSCRSTPDTPPPPRAQSDRSMQRQSETAQDYAVEIQRAPDAASEAAALTRFRNWAVKRGYTYVVRPLRTDAPDEVSNPTGQAGPVRVEVQVFQGDRPVHLFRFIPKDNRNITIIAKGI